LESVAPLAASSGIEVESPSVVATGVPTACVASAVSVITFDGDCTSASTLGLAAVP
jgi:hypothetical protein